MPLTTKTKPKAQDLTDVVKAAVAEVLAERESQRSEGYPRRGKALSGASVFLIIVLVGFIASGVYNFLEMRELRKPLDATPADQARAMDTHLYTICMRIEQYYEANQAYPVSIHDMRMQTGENLEYTRISKHEYSLRYHSDGIVRTYNSRQPLASLLSDGFARSTFSAN